MRKNKIVNTKQTREQSLIERGDLIKESFKKEFGKIKRLDEVDYNDVYSKIKPNDKQRMKIDDYPALGKNLEAWLTVADTALNSSDWKAKESARHRFLMDDDELQEYYGKLVKIKSAIEKANNGEALDDFEKRIVRFYKTDKGNQNSRINKMAKDKIGGDFMKNHDGTVSGDKTFSGINKETNEPVNIEIIGNTNVTNDHGDMAINYPVSIDGELGKLKVYGDTSHGFELDSGEFINIRFKDRPDFISTDAKKLQNVYPEKNK